jgi:hypothetical protein
MSGINGDKSRFHRERKQKIAKRNRNRKLLKNMTEQPKAVMPAAGVKVKVAE